MTRIAARILVTAAILVAWPFLCIAAALYITGLVAHSILGEWVK